MSISTNFFGSAKPTKGGSFTDAKPTKSSNTFVNAAPTMVSEIVWGGDNVSGTVYGVDYGSFGQSYGTETYGGYSHYLNRTTPPVISH